MPAARHGVLVLGGKRNWRTNNRKAQAQQRCAEHDPGQVEFQTKETATAGAVWHFRYIHQRFRYGRTPCNVLGNNAHDRVGVVIWGVPWWLCTAFWLSPFSAWRA